VQVCEGNVCTKYEVDNFVYKKCSWSISRWFHKTWSINVQVCEGKVCTKYEVDNFVYKKCSWSFETETMTYFKQIWIVINMKY
jgi:hypothetical protein